MALGPISMTSFVAGDIYATAFASSTDFHYTLSVMINSRTCMKYHATERATGYFNFEAREHNLTMSNTLCVALKIGHLPENFTIDQVTKLLKAIPMALSDQDRETETNFDCRTWVKEAIRVLNTAGVITCSDANDIVDGELGKYALENEDAIKGGFGGPQVYISQYST